MPVQTKICGIKTPETIRVACEAGARYLGFVFYPPSPRYIEPDIAKELVYAVPTGVRSVGLFVDPSDAQLEHVLGRVQLDMIQLHGAETVQRCGEIKARYNMPIIKAFGVGNAQDLEVAEDYRDVADIYLFDNVKGGSGECFDWALLEGRRFSKSWMLSGGLTADNVTDALSILSPGAVDVSSGVEVVRGEKDSDKIRAFLAAVKAL